MDCQSYQSWRSREYYQKQKLHRGNKIW